VVRRWSLAKPLVGCRRDAGAALDFAGIRLSLNPRGGTGVFLHAWLGFALAGTGQVPSLHNLVPAHSCSQIFLPLTSDPTFHLTYFLYFCNYRNVQTASSRKSTEQVAKYADMLSAMGTEPRLRIMRLLLSAHPEGLVVGDIQSELDIPNSTLSHHLDKLKNEELVNVQRESTFLRYTANTEALQDLLQFLYAECCTRNKAVKPQDIVQICR
jgi:ArsR family transcriptional regulator, arsenate/arsenite/antimonite-responsive transcriptional repressor